MSFEAQDEVVELLEDVGSHKRVSATKIKAVVDICMKYHKYYKYIVHDMEKALRKSDNKVSILYCIDALIKHARHKYGAKDTFTPRFEKNIKGTCSHLFHVPAEEKNAIRKVLNQWMDKKLMDEAIIKEAAIEAGIDLSVDPEKEPSSSPLKAPSSTSVTDAVAPFTENSIAALQNTVLNKFASFMGSTSSSFNNNPTTASVSAGRLPINVLPYNPPSTSTQPPTNNYYNISYSAGASSSVIDPRDVGTAPPDPRVTQPVFDPRDDGGTSFSSGPPSMSSSWNPYQGGGGGPSSSYGAPSPSMMNGGGGRGGGGEAWQSSFMPPGAGNTGFPRVSDAPPKPQIKFGEENPRFKTSMCKSVDASGISRNCKFGDTCQFAHTLEELRRPAGFGPRGIRGRGGFQSNPFPHGSSYGAAPSPSMANEAVPSTTNNGNMMNYYTGNTGIAVATEPVGMDPRMVSAPPAPTPPPPPPPPPPSPPRVVVPAPIVATPSYGFASAVNVTSTAPVKKLGKLVVKLNKDKADDGEPASKRMKL